jgi:hypothetical protein
MTKIHEVPNLSTYEGDLNTVFDIVYNACTENERLIISLIKLNNIKSYLQAAQSAPGYTKHWEYYQNGLNTVQDLILSQENVLYSVQTSRSYYYGKLNPRE